MLLNRRFARTKALQNLYAFYVAKRANQDYAKKQLRELLTPHVFETVLPSPAQLSQEQEQAQALLSKVLSNPLAKTEALIAASSQHRVQAAVQESLNSYKQAMAKDEEHLRQGFREAIREIDQASARVVQLLVAWAHVAQQRADKPRLRQAANPTPTLGLHQNATLQWLQTDPAWAQHVRTHAASWTKDQHLVESWYHQLIKKDPQVTRLLTEAPEQLLTYLVDNIIWKQTPIQDFFEEHYSGWFAHQHIVKKMLRNTLRAKAQYGAKDSKLYCQSVAAEARSYQEFYASLVEEALTRDAHIEVAIAQHARNWSIDRLVLIDKIIMKLAVCEMLYAEDVPTKVTINEYIELSKLYSTPKSSQFVNGLLDAVARQCNPANKS
ncbi:MAG: transcription antitermination factor NusB [Bacteroidota bacterium]